MRTPPPPGPRGPDDEPSDALSWSEADAERRLRSLELFGMRFGLDRMRRLATALGSPQCRFDTIQVLGTNGKSSTTRMLAAILARHGLRTGTYTSPHLVSWRERIQVDEREIDSERFARAVAHASAAAERVNRTLDEDDHVTQFELLTAAALWEMAERDVEVAVVEAGLGGRFDATSVIDANVTVLTNVGLEHTRWLGPTVTHIAEEKLAVVREGGVLVLGSDISPPALAVAQRIAAERGAEVIRAGAEAATGAREAAAPLAAEGAFQRRNFALARAAAEAYLRLRGIALREQAVAAAAAETLVPGRMHVLADPPLTVIDGAHNPDAVAALLESLPGVLREHGGDAGPAAPLGLVLGVLEDKDAASMLASLLPLCAHAWFTAPPSSRALSPAALESLARQLSFEQVTLDPRPASALAAARAWAGEHGGSVLATGSVYLVGDLLAGARAADNVDVRRAAGKRSSG
jgi:dihydrofolate synthase/folylpolyglutamate synthase